MASTLDNQSEFMKERFIVPNISFISLFVPNLAETALRYASLLEVSPSDDSHAAPAPHPFATKGPVVFRLGAVSLALYECDGRITHPGDVGIGLECAVAQTVDRLASLAGTVIWGPTPIGETERKLAVGMMPDRHFFELVGTEGG